MSDRSKHITRHETAKPQTFIDATINHFGSCQRPGYYLTMTPIEDKGDGIITWLVTQANNTLVEPAKRFSSKTLEQVARNVYDTPQYHEQLKQICERAKLELKGEETREGTIQTALQFINDGEPELAEQVIKRLYEAETQLHKKKLLEKALAEITIGSPEKAETYLWMAEDDKHIGTVLTPDIPSAA